MDSHAREQAFGQYLLGRSLLSEALLRQAQDVSADTRDPLVRSLAKLGFMPEVSLADALSEFSEFPRLAQPLSLAESLGGLSVEFLKFHGIAPLSITEQEITVAVSNPLDDAGIRGVEFATTRRAKPLIATLSDVDSAFAMAFGDTGDAGMVDETDSDGSIEALRDLASDAPAIRLVQRLITMAVDRKASDIHIDSENRLMTAAVGGSATVTINYDYDALGRRASKTVTGLGTTSYLLDGDEEIAEYNGATLARRYITGPGVDDRIMHFDVSTNTRTYYHTNHQGSVMAMTDGSGNLTQRIGYDEYGNGSPTTGEQFGYTGRRYDPETGLYYYRARYYAPAIGRFLQVDPVGYKDNLNLYTYVGNDPLDKTDPTGEDFVVPSWTTVGYALAAVGVEVGGLGPEDPAGDAGAAYFGRQAALSYGRDVAAAALQKPDGVEGRLQPVKDAEGPHSTYKRGPDGTINKTAEYKPNARNPSGHDEVKRTDTTGKSHFNKVTNQDVPTPHTHDPATPGGVRPATPDEIPKAAQSPPPPPPPPPQQPLGP
jgi:RHS repeat-associated protein